MQEKVLNLNRYLAPVVGGLIGAGIGAIGSLFGQKKGNDAAIKAVQEQNKGNMKLAEYQYEKNLEQWMRENEYNSPKSQMQRYADAGLNPNLIYGSGSSGNAGSSPQLEMPHLSAYTDFGDMGASGAVAAFQRQEQLNQLSALREEQTNLARTQADYNQQRALSEAVNRTYTEAKRAGQMFRNNLLDRYGEQQVKASLQQSFQNIRTMKAQETNLLSQSNLADARTEYALKQSDHESLKMLLTKATTYQRLKATELMQENIPLIRAKVAQTLEQTQLTREQAIHEVLKQHGSYLKNQLQQLGLDNWQTLKFADWIAKVL